LIRTLINASTLVRFLVHSDIFVTNAGVTIPCATFSGTEAICELNPDCQFDDGTSTCVDCAAGPGQCGPITTPCAELSATVCLEVPGRCVVADNQCVDAQCANVFAQADCTLLSGCVWSNIAGICLDKGENAD
jgi:hypothetical protein